MLESFSVRDNLLFGVSNDVTEERIWDVLEEEIEPRWMILVKHRSGSLEAAVARVRNRNLAISFGALLLLAGSVLMIIVSTRRAQRLASQQMEFVAGVSHELRTPLASIRVFGELMRLVITIMMFGHTLCMVEETFIVLFHLCQHPCRRRQVRIEHAGELGFNTGKIVFTIVRQIEQLGDTLHPVT